jgi:precorrin-6Y C5,15-methyltransferase (decarboxylating)
MQFVIYTLDLGILADTKIIFDKVGIKNMEAMQISVSKTNKDNIFVAQPAPWLITGGIE